MNVTQETSNPNEAAQTEPHSSSKSGAEDNKEDCVVLSSHNNVNTDIGRRFQCDKCLEWTSGVNDFISHLKTHEDSPKCPYCNNIFHKTEINNHMMCHMSNGRYVCLRCEKSFLTSMKVRIHFKTHDKDKKYVCPECNHRLTTLYLLRRHMHSHFALRSFHCQICTKSFKDTHSLKRHQNHQHDPNARPHTCQECGKSFKRELTLRYHMMVHSGSNVYQCDVCGEMLPNPIMLSAHRSTHKKTWYQCEKCDKTYTTKTGLRKHLLGHEGSLTYKCMECAAQFVHKQSFDRHVATHTGELRTTCPICKKVVSSPNYLKIHMKFHENKRDFVCDECGKKFNSNHYLAIHSKVHIDKKFKCSYCDQTCRYKANLTKHMRRKHEKKTDEEK